MINTSKIKKEVLDLIFDINQWKYKNDYLGYTQTEFSENMSKKYEYLYTNSKTLFERCILGNLKIEHLDYILSMIEKVNNGGDFKKISQEVGQKMVDFYVKPVLEKK